MDGKISLCSACRVDLPRVEYACDICALPIKSDSDTSVCGQCIAQKPYVDYSINLFHYATPVDYLISQMKFHHQLSVAAVLANLLESHVLESQIEHGLPDAVLPVPLHNKRLVERGFNQSLEILKPIAKSKNIPVLLNSVARSKETRTQTHLSKRERKQNIAGCFSLLKKPEHSHIVIVDDVVTTGATTNELAKVLKKSGVQTSGCMVVSQSGTTLKPNTIRARKQHDKKYDRVCQ